MKLAVLILALLMNSCIVPTPGIMRWEICLSYGNRPVIKQTMPDGTVIERADIDTEEQLRQIMRACRD